MHEPQDDGPLRLTIVLSALLTGLLVLAGYGCGAGVDFAVFSEHATHDGVSLAPGERYTLDGRSLAVLRTRTIAPDSAG